MAEKQQFYSLRDTLTVLFKHKYKIIVPFTVISVITIFLAVSAPAHYIARALIMVDPWGEHTSTGESFPNMRLPIISQESIINTEIQILTSNDVLVNVITSMGVYNLYPDLKKTLLGGNTLEEAAVLLFKQDLLVKEVEKSNVIAICFRHENPHIAQKVTNLLVECMKDKNRQVFGISKSTFLEDQLKFYDEKLKEAQTKLATYKQENNIINLKDQFWHIIGKRTELNAILKMEESKLWEVQNKIAFVKNQKKKAVSDLYTAETRIKLTELERRETALLTTYKENSRPVNNIRQEIKTVRDALAKYEEENKGSGEWAVMEAELGPQQVKISNVKRQVAQLDRELRALSSADKEYGRLEREIDTLQKHYESYLRKYEEAKMAEGLDHKKTNIQVIEQASLPISPVKANQKNILGIGMLLALFIGFALAYFAEHITQTITIPQGITKHLRLPVLVAVSFKEMR